ncbi:SEL1-like repeat protein [Salegentibacter sp. F14]
MDLLRKYSLLIILLGITHSSLAQSERDYGEYNEAVDYLDQGNTEKALRLFDKLCRQNNGAACFAIGITYYQGDQVEKNVTKGLEFIKKAAEKNNYDGIKTLGEIYFHGSAGVEKDPKKATELFKKSIAHEDNYENRQKSKAAEMANSLTGENTTKNFPKLGALLGGAFHMEKDYINASSFYLLALNGPEGFTSTEEELWKVLLKNAETFASQATYTVDFELAHFLGDYYLRSSNTGKGLNYYRIAVDGKNAEAQRDLGKYYYEENDLTKAKAFLELAVENSSGEVKLTSMENLIPIYLEHQQWTQAMNYSKMVMKNNDFDDLNINQDFFKIFVNNNSPYSDDWSSIGKTDDANWYYNSNSIVKSKENNYEYFIVVKESSRYYTGGKIFGAVFNLSKDEYYTYAEYKGTSSNSSYSFPSKYEIITTQYEGDLYDKIESIIYSHY